MTTLRRFPQWHAGEDTYTRTAPASGASLPATRTPAGSGGADGAFHHRNDREHLQLSGGKRGQGGG